ncbi:MAG: YlxR family protein [Actinomycetales bacterium]
MEETGSSDRQIPFEAKSVSDAKPLFPARPERTCVGCRRRDTQSQLLRIVRDLGSSGTAAVVPDPRRRLAGRGAWLHPDAGCLALALKKRAFSRAFRGPVDTAAVEDYLSASAADA